MSEYDNFEDNIPDERALQEPEPVRDEEYFEQGHSSPHNPPAEIERKTYVARTSRDELNELAFSKPSQARPANIPTAENALADLAKILGTKKDGERVLSDKAAQIWDLLYPYIASEDPPDLSVDAEAELLTTDTLPKVWDLVLAVEDE